jgi:Fe-S-cluster containining protein
MRMIQFVPWQQIANWRCVGCGSCCKDYSVVLKFAEWLKIVNTFGTGTTATGFNKLFLKRAEDGSCSFLYHYAGKNLCALQQIKPDACKIWPFKVLAEPMYGEEKHARYVYGCKTLYVYCDSNCSGLRYGSPTWQFSSLILKEFVGIAIGTRRTQHNTTSSANFCGL